ncbi:hypothetical protein BGAL_0234g00130 [Botrytis galanthina]|uniref:Uncharacterized protein n=1 Tax=Botrytis galanthina TaxID=278940 RepID=A0A4S8QTS2_9HELO|nr:hypothetical protein BGAL_0234g00130 [Botrytis galanthina]
MSSDSWETRNYVGEKILNQIFENWNERFATMKQEYKRKGKVAMEVQMTIELPDHTCKQMWAESDGEIEVEQRSEEDGNVHGDAIAHPIRGESNLRVEANAPTTQGKGQDVGNVHSRALVSRAPQSRNMHIETIARPAPKTSKENSNLHSGAVASISQQNRNSNIAPKIRPAPKTVQNDSNVQNGALASISQNSLNPNIAPTARPASNSMRSVAIVPVTQNSRNSNITSDVRPTPRIIQNNSNMHNGAIAPPNQRQANIQNLAPGRPHRSSSSARTTQNPPVSTTAGSSANLNPTLYLERRKRELQQELSRQERESREYESARGGSKRSRDSDAGHERRKYPRGDYSSRRNR